MTRGRLRYPLAALLCLLALALQVSALPMLRLPWATPDLLLIVVVAVGLGYDEFTGMLAGFAAGFMLDIVPPADHAIGRTALVLCLTGYLAGRYRRRARRSAVRTLLLVAALVVFSVLVQTGLSFVVGDQAANTRTLVRLLAADVGYTVLLAAFVMPAALAMVRWLDRRPVERNALEASVLRSSTGIDQDESVLVP
jgi:rod shape-determining protein MreD